MVVGAALLAAAIAAHGQSSHPLIVATQTCSSSSNCETKVDRYDLDGNGSQPITFPAPRQDYFTDLGLALDRSLFVLDYTRGRLYSPDGVEKPRLNTRKELLNSVTFDASGNAYVGVFNFGKSTLKKFDSRHLLVTQYKTKHPVYAIDLSDDQCTLYYTSDPRGAQVVHRYNVCAKQNMSDWGTISSFEVNQIHLLPDGGMLVAASSEVLRLSPGAMVLRRYDIGGDDHWNSVSLSADQKSVWASTINGVAQFDLETGRLLKEVATGSRVVGFTLEDGWHAAANTEGRPNAPTDLHVTLTDDGKMQLAFHDNSLDETGFNIEYRINEGSYIYLGTVAPNRALVTVTGFKHARLYTFRVQAFNDKGVSGYSNEASLFDH